MSWRDFLKMEDQTAVPARVQLYHLRDPRFLVEIEAPGEGQAPGEACTIRRMCLQNSSLGNYHRIAPLLREALRFYARTLEKSAGSSGAWSRG